MLKISRRERVQKERLSIFKENRYDRYEEKKIGDCWYVKHWEGSKNKWIVDAYSEQSFHNMKAKRKIFIETPKASRWKLGSLREPIEQKQLSFF